MVMVNEGTVRSMPDPFPEPETAARFRQLANRYRALDVAHDDWKTRRVLKKLIRDYENAATAMDDAAEREPSIAAERADDSLA